MIQTMLRHVLCSVAEPGLAEPGLSVNSISLHLQVPSLHTWFFKEKLSVPSTSFCRYLPSMSPPLVLAFINLIVATQRRLPREQTGSSGTQLQPQITVWPCTLALTSALIHGVLRMASAL